MSEPQLNQLLDRIVEQAPSVGIEGEQMLAAGKRRVRRRRAVGGGMAIAALALAGALWSGLGGGGLVGSLWDPVEPAGTSTEIDRPALDRTLTIPGEDLELSVDGDAIVATGPDGTTYRTEVAAVRGTAGLLTLVGQGSPVVYVSGWQLTDGESARVGSRAEDGTIDWVEPMDVAGVEVPGQGAARVVALSFEGAPPPGELVFGQVQPDGSVKAAPLTVEPLLAGVAVEVSPDTGLVEAVSRDGKRLLPAEQQPEGQLSSWRDADGWTLVLVEGRMTGTVVPVLDVDGRPTAAADRLGGVGEIHAQDRTFLAARVEPVAPVLALAVEDTEQRTSGVANFWHLPGLESRGNVVIDDGLGLVSRSGLWLFVQTTDDGVHEPQFGRVDEDLLAFPVEGGLRYAALLSDGDPAGLVTTAQGDSTLEKSSLDGRMTLVYGTAPALGPSDRLGLDVDADGSIDVPLRG